ncbi:patatin-like phospholipase family protein [Postechiella marina]|uniref:Patatin-like phospholipase family protein n=1 Tax=Postechiella marina TaxID=943941 RepID=A0ABP8C806_9FLAO
MNKKLIILTLFFFAIYSAKAQKSKQETQPKIGLVLSGGGAKGLAHIGALKIIDSLGVKVDYVAGTSMGAIIGSLYSAGYSGNQIDSIFRKVDFDKIINDDTPRAAKVFYERSNSEKYAITLPYNNFKIKLPSALSRGQNTFGLLSRLTLHVCDVDEFNKLPIPFFCIATNVETGKAVVLEKGSLTQSVMASAALPTLFQPVTIGNKVLIDGGVVNNYPIDELRAKGMDVIIGVDVQDGLLKRDALVSAPDVLLQINNFRSIKAMESKVKKTNVYIKPDIVGYSVVSFDEGSNIIKQGERAARLKINDLKNLVGSAPKPKVIFKPQDSIIINSSKIRGITNYTRSYVLGKLKIKSNEKISYENFTKGVNNLIATNNFDSFQYQFIKTQKEDEYNLIADVRETKTNTFIKASIHYDDLYKSAVLVNLTKKRLLFDNDVASLDFILGDNVRYNFEYLIDKGFYWSIGFKSRFNTFNKNISAQLLLNDDEIEGTGLNKIDADVQDQTNQLYVQTLIKKDFALSLGGEHKRLELKSETITINNDETEDFVFEKTDYFSIFAQLKLDTYDNKYFPTKGVYFNGDVHTYLFASAFNDDFENFSIAKADLGYAFSISNKIALNFETNGGFKMGDKSTQTLDFALGGYGNNLINNFTPFIGYDFLSLTGNSFVKASVKADYEILKNNHIILEANWANVGEDIFENGEWFTLPDYRGYGLGYALDTFVGPIEVKYSYSPEEGQSVWFFNLGFWF